MFGEVPSNVTEQEGNDVMLNCGVTGNPVPIPRFFWKFTPSNDNVTESTEQPSNNAVANNLPLMSIHRDQAGTYTCFAQSPFQTLSAKAVVIVTCMLYGFPNYLGVENSSV